MIPNCIRSSLVQMITSKLIPSSPREHCQLSTISMTCLGLYVIVYILYCIHILYDEEYKRWLLKVKLDWRNLKEAPRYIRNNKNVVLAAIQSDDMGGGHVLQYASDDVRNNKDIIIAAVRKNGLALQYGSPQIQNDYDVVATAIKGDRTGRVLRFASPDLRNNKNLAMSAVQQDGRALEFVSPTLQCDKDVVVKAIQQDDRALHHVPVHLMFHDTDVAELCVQSQQDDTQIKYEIFRCHSSDRKAVIDAVRQDGMALGYASPCHRNDKNIVMAAVRHDGMALGYASPGHRKDRNIVTTAVRQNGKALMYASPEMQNDEQVALAAVQNDGMALGFASPTVQHDKEVALAAVMRSPDAIKYVRGNLKKDPDLLIASGMFNAEHISFMVRRSIGTPKIVLSTRFALNPASHSEATNFTAMFKRSKFLIESGSFEIYAPNANFKGSCEYHPCRGTKETCQYPCNVLTDDGRPTDDCCWRYSFRNQLQEACNTGGFMLQLVETGQASGLVEYATLGKGQAVELDMARSIGTKVFQVYRPEEKLGSGYEDNFLDCHIDIVSSAILQWYNNDCLEMSVTVIYP